MYIYHCMNFRCGAILCMGFGVYPDSLCVVVTDQSHREETTTALSNLEYINQWYHARTCMLYSTDEA